MPNASTGAPPATRYTRPVPTLHVVATPIGNLADITLRALEVLRSVDVIACEDTRHSRRLLSHHQITTRVVAYGHGEAGAARVMGELRNGSEVALITDAGTPGISDPGAAAVAAARAEGYPVSPIPGPSALAALLSVAGASVQHAVFYGFLSPKPGRRRRQLAGLLQPGWPFVLYESPHRILAALQDLSDAAPERKLVVGRELSKVHEEVLTGTAQVVLTELSNRPKIQGEFSVFVAADSGAAEAVPEAEAHSS